MVMFFLHFSFLSHSCLSKVIKIEKERQWCANVNELKISQLLRQTGLAAVTPQLWGPLECHIKWKNWNLTESYSTLLSISGGMTVTDWFYRTREWVLDGPTCEFLLKMVFEVVMAIILISKSWSLQDLHSENICVLTTPFNGWSCWTESCQPQFIDVEGFTYGPMGLTILRRELKKFWSHVLVLLESATGPGWTDFARIVRSKIHPNWFTSAWDVTRMQVVLITVFFLSYKLYH